MIEEINEKDTLLMKLLHYFMIKKNYKPIILQGIQDEIWLENLQSDYKIIRLVSHYIHNDEQMQFDIVKTKRIIKTIKKKTFNFSMPTISIYLNLGENAHLQEAKNIYPMQVEDEEDLKKYDFFVNYFDDITNNLEFTEEGVELFLKVSSDINEKSRKEQVKLNRLFNKNVPIITYILIGTNILMFFLDLLFPDAFLLERGLTYGPYIRDGEIWRLLTGEFFHGSILHLLVNMYSLYVIGSQVENFFGKAKYLLIYIFSAVTASALSIILNINTASIGASGAIFGLTGALLYFGYYYRVYFGNALISQIVPIIIINLIFGFTIPGIDNYAHIGGLIGGLLLAMAIGMKTDEESHNRLHGTILTVLYVAFLIFMNVFVIK